MQINRRTVPPFIDPADIAESLRGEVDRRGYGVTVVTRDLDLRALASAVGPIVRSLRFGAESKMLRPYDVASAPPSSMSSRTGFGEQPMHSDCAYMPTPPRYTMLVCRAPGEGICATNVWVLDMHFLLRDGHPALVRPGWVVRGQALQSPFYAQPLNRTWYGTPFVRFDPCCMTPPRQEGLTIELALNAFATHAIRERIEWVEGAVLLIDNWRCLHGRGPGAESAQGRRIERWLLGNENGLVG